MASGHQKIYMGTLPDSLSSTEQSLNWDYSTDT